jgi:hypothetical protein
VAQHAEEVQRIGLLGPAREDVQQRRLGLLDALVAQVVDRARERLRQRRLVRQPRAGI